jgi:hypothetical protein
MNPQAGHDTIKIAERRVTDKHKKESPEDRNEAAEESLLVAAVGPGTEVLLVVGCTVVVVVGATPGEAGGIVV